MYKFGDTPEKLPITKIYYSKYANFSHNINQSKVFVWWKNYILNSQS